MDRSRRLARVWLQWLFAFSAGVCLGGCKVYDTALMRDPLHHAQDGGAGKGEAPDAALDAQAPVQDSGSPDAMSSEPECVPTEDPSCPERCRERCNGSDDDCDGVVDESSTDTLCPLPSATAVCTQGKCLIASCNSGHVDCNELPEDGCEATLDATEHCGTCGNACGLANAAASCVDGQCNVKSCQERFGDCDQRSDNGCERPLTTLSDCGSCGKSCGIAHATADCGAGTCSFRSCSAGYGDCNKDTSKGSASDGCETDLRLRDNCGQCGNRCPDSAPYCTGGKCSALSCSGATADCDMDNKTCETDLHTVQNCGACGASCGSPANAAVSCSTGSCQQTCNAGYASCDGATANGCETDLHTTSNCGSCSMACNFANAASACPSGSCQLGSCNGGYGNCDANTGNGCEQRLNTNTHCGGCGKACSLSNASASCSSGSCQIASCNAGYGNCDGNTSNGCEQQLNTNTHCAGCGQACNLSNASASCSTGSCQLGSCNGGFANCDNNAANGCEVNLDTSAANCGGCGKACPGSFSCQGGQCVCTSDANCGSGQSCCNGACVDLQNDEANCGRCGGACGSGQTCCGGSCKSLSSDFDNCGSCGRGCDSGKTNRCSGGQCLCANDGACSSLFKCCSSGCKLTLICF